jgi:hypothetical protein
MPADSRATSTAGSSAWKADLSVFAIHRSAGRREDRSVARLPWTAIVVLSMAGFPTSARAQIEPIRVTYRASAECPSESQFLQEIEGRTQLARWANGAEHARAFVATVTPDKGTFRGQLLITSLDGTTSSREVTGDTCSEVASALALITALAIDPSAAIEPRASPAGDGPAIDGTIEDGHPPGAPWENARPLRPIASAQLQSASPGAVTSDSPASPSPSTGSSSTQDTHWAMGVEGESLAGLVPAWGMGGGAFVDVAGRARGNVVPAVRGSLFAMGNRAQFAGPVGADLSWFVARVQACPVRFVLEAQVALSLCAGLDGGILRSGGTGLQRITTEVRPWFAAVALGRVTWPQAGPFFVEGEGGLVAPFTRYSFYFSDAGLPNTVHQIAVLGASLGIDAGYRFR